MPTNKRKGGNRAKSGNKIKGNWAEEKAAAYLLEKGYEIVEANYRSPWGEIDMIVRRETVLAFVEVKYRTDLQYGYPREAVGYYKQRTIRRVAQAYLSGRRIEGLDFRFDVIEILGREDPIIEHIENAF